MNTPHTGEILGDALYTLERAKQITGLGEGAFRSMRRHGLPVRYVAGRGFIEGRALIEHIAREGKQTK